MRSKQERREEMFFKAHSTYLKDAPPIPKNALFKQSIRFFPHVLIQENFKTPSLVLPVGGFKNRVTAKKGLWEVIMPFYGTLGAGGNLPNYLTQDNCNILSNGTGILILKDMFLELMEATSILEDFNLFCFFNSSDATENRYQINYHFEEFKDIDNINADEILITRRGYK